MHDMGYRPCLADPDVWLRPAVKQCGFKYYEYVLTYVDDCLAISDNPKVTMQGIQAKFKLKNDKYAEPTDYLGATLVKMTTASGTECWTQSSDKYIMASIQSVEATLAEKGNKLPVKCVTPFCSGYRPECDITAELGADGHKYFQELIGMLRWAVEIGRLDILLEVSMLSHHLALPREGHLEQAMHIFGYLKLHPKGKSLSTQITQWLMKSGSKSMTGKISTVEQKKQSQQMRQNHGVEVFQRIALSMQALRMTNLLEEAKRGS